MSQPRLYQWTLRAAVVLIAVIASVHVGLRSQLLPSARVDLGGAELNVVHGFQKMMLGRPLYEDPERPPFDVMQYPPAYYALCAGIGEVLHVDPYDTRSLFLLGRVVSLALNLLTCLMVFLLCRACDVERWLAVAVGALTFTLFTEHFYARVDSLYAFFFTATLLAYARWSLDEQRTRLLLLAGMLSVLCVLSKQTGILVLGILLLHLLIGRNYRALLLFVSSAIITMGVGLLLTLQHTTWEVLTDNIVQGIANGMTRTMYIELLDPSTYKYYVGWHIAAAILIAAQLRTADPVGRFFAIAMGASFLFGAVTGLKHGSNINYLFEAHLLVFVAGARWSSLRRGRWQMAVTVVAMLYAVFFATYRTRILHKRLGTAAYEQLQEALYRADVRTRDVLVHELGLQPQEHVLITYRGHLELLLNGQGFLDQKDIIEWSTRPLFDYAAFDQAMTSGTVRYVISDAPVDTVHMLGHAYPLGEEVRVVEGRHIHTLTAH